MSEVVSIEWKNKIAIMWIDNPPVNALSHPVRQGIMDGLETTKKEQADAVVIAGRNNTLIAGADIKEFAQGMKEPLLPEVCDAIEANTIPVVAFIQGNTLGGGLETALGCHYRVADQKAKIGLPEVMLGLIPGASGTQRVPRATKNPIEAVTLAASGKPIRSDKAKEIGIVDEIVEDIDGAVKYAESIAKESIEERRLSKVELEWNDQMSAMFDTIIAETKKRAKGMLAPVKAAECVRAAWELPYEEGVNKERQTFMELMMSEQSDALRHIFFAQRTAAKSSVEAKPREIKKVGIIGAGTMGGGISMTFVEAGFPVTILEMSDEAIKKGMSVIQKNWERGIAKGRITEEEIERRMSQYKTTTSYDDLKDCDLIIEAVFETMEIKTQVFSTLNQIAKPNAILATNTSYLDVNKIAQVTDRPQDVIGMHYFSPANVMKLLEVVKASKTADDVVVTALDVAKKTKKQPVVAGVCHGFIGNRMLTPYIKQASLLVMEGASPEQVDNALTNFGWAMGVFAVSDLAGLDIGYKSRQDQPNLSEEEKQLYSVVDKLVEKGFVGQKSGAGFYVYDKQTRDKKPNPEAMTIIEETRNQMGFEARDVTDEEIVERTQYALINEGARILSEGIAERASDIDVAYVYGYGFPPWRGGPMKYAQTVGLKNVAQKLKEYASGPNGQHWELDDTLVNEEKFAV